MQPAIAVTEFLYSRDLAPASLRYYTGALTPFVDFLALHNVDDVAHIEPSTVREFLDTCKSRQNRNGNAVSSYTVHAYARAIRAFLRFLVSDDLLDPRVTKRLVMPRLEKKVIPILTPAHLDALMRATTSTRDKAILAVLYDTGIRAQELCGLTLVNVHFDVNGAWLKVRGKGNRWREVGIGRKARALLHRYIHRERPAIDSPYVFQGNRGPLTPSGLDQLLYALRDRVGRKYFQGIRVSAHTLRHSFAVAYLEQGGDIYRLSRLLGHTDISTTTGYLRAFTDRSARQGASVLDMAGER
jgi:site-specific recombinase XerD